MKITKNIGMLLLGVYLILAGLLPLINLQLGGALPILAVVAGVFILIGR